MHEFALAEAVVTSALREADRAGIGALRRIEVSIGELQHIRVETFEFALREVIPAGEPRLAGVEILIETEPAGFRCRACERRFRLEETGGPKNREESEAIHFIPELAHSFLRCPGCASPDFEVERGRGVVLRRIEGDSP